MQDSRRSQLSIVETTTAQASPNRDFADRSLVQFDASLLVTGNSKLGDGLPTLTTVNATNAMAV
jgi:hypothetical protein